MPTGVWCCDNLIESRKRKDTKINKERSRAYISPDSLYYEVYTVIYSCFCCQL